MERETGIEPATNSLEGCDSTTELLPRSVLILPSLCYTGRVNDIPILNALVYGVTGILIFAAAFSIFVKVWPIDLWREIRERNVAAAIVAGAVALGLCWIIAATMH